MIVLLLNGSKSCTRAYKKRLAKWGDEVVEKKYDLSKVPWDGKSPSKEWLDALGVAVYKEYQFAVDVVQVLFDKKDWKSSSKTLRGTHFGTPRNGYELGIFWNRKGWEDTGAHELGHTKDDFVYTYSGKNLGRLVGVNDWDEDVVHKKNKKGNYTYDYDTAFNAAQKWVDEACRGRDTLANQAASLYKQIGYSLRVSLRKLTANTKSL